MTINDPVKVLRERRRQHEAVCCTSVASLLPGADNQQASAASGIRAEFSTSPCPVQQSNGPTASGAGEAVTPAAYPAPPVHGQAAAEHPDPRAGADGAAQGGSQNALGAALRRFYDDLHRTLPEPFLLDEEIPCICDAKGNRLWAPIRVASHARRADGTGWMLEIEFLDGDLQLQRLSVARADLECKPRLLLPLFADRGFRIHSFPEDVPVFLRLWDHVPRSWRADHPGWFESPAGASCYLRPDGTRFAPARAAEEVFLAGSPRCSVSRAGSFDGWRAEVAARALGNPALVFAISASLAGPLLCLAGIQTAGFNFYGSEASGKSLLLHVAMSCLDHPHRVNPWAAATTGLQRLSAEAQDGLLALDGFPLQPDGRQAKTLLALGNDAGAGRPHSDRDPDGGQRWRRMILSSSEIPVSHSLQRGKQDAPAPLLRRMMDLPAEVGTYGVIEELHGESDGASFARGMELALHRHHGHLLPAFLDQLVASFDIHTESLRAKLPQFTRRVQDDCLRAAALSPAAETAGAERFALVGYAGELAIGFDLLPWKTGTAQEAALRMASLAHHAAPASGWDQTRARAELRRFIAQKSEQIIDLEAEAAPAGEAAPVGWQDRDHLYLRGDPMRDELAELDEMLAAIDDILVPGGEARSRQYRMPAAKVTERPRVYRFDRSALE
ncbi:DUF927 domain-containing protein [Paracoccus aestuarii]|uniref:DUF927 domain-containing protein n=1 Tax=Paracoccus aestuarii TaxID=453842 RepID=A0A418ZYA6_9RHOB|nr:DUF927 domain-containing protein [Paracoccus aestuarii]RJL05506.1 DUF927 domain-containing protein [Paracoccus aestuarii]WCQ98628.1 DUF927 domain-containing protein [Paracoccus aestuarii]